MLIGVISDTHDMLRPEVLHYLQDCDVILHSGDISSRVVLDKLKKIAPVYAVRGNADRKLADELPETAEFMLAGIQIFMAHKRRNLPEDHSLYDLMVFGHSHQYVNEWIEGSGKRTLLLNPGSCGPRRFNQAVTMALLQAGADGITADRIDVSHTERACVFPAGDLRKQIELVVRETKKGRSPAEIARKYGMESELAEQIARLYVTHPGVGADGILNRMGI